MLGILNRRLDNVYTEWSTKLTFVAGKRNMSRWSSRLPDHLEVQLSISKKNWVARPNRTLLTEEFTKSGGENHPFSWKHLNPTWRRMYFLESQPGCQSPQGWLGQAVNQSKTVFLHFHWRNFHNFILWSTGKTGKPTQQKANSSWLILFCHIIQAGFWCVYFMTSAENSSRFPIEKTCQNVIPNHKVNWSVLKSNQICNSSKVRIQTNP